MPASTEKQRKFMGAELARKRKGKKTKTKMSKAQLEDFARKPIKSAAAGSFTMWKATPQAAPAGPEGASVSTPGGLQAVPAPTGDAWAITASDPRARAQQARSYARQLRQTRQAGPAVQPQAPLEPSATSPWWPNSGALINSFLLNNWRQRTAPLAVPVLPPRARAYV